MRKQNVRSIVWLLLLLFAARPVAHADEPVVRAVLFWAQTCPHCHVVLNETLPPLQAQYGDQFQVLAVEVSDPAGYQLWRAAMDALRVPDDQRGVPMLFIGNQVLVGSYDIPDQLPGLIEKHLASGGLDYPAIPGLVGHRAAVELAPPAPLPTPSPTAAPPTPEPAATDSVVHFWLFWSSHCPDCVALMENVLPDILAQYDSGQIEMRQWDLEKGGYELMLGLGMAGERAAPMMRQHGRPARPLCGGAGGVGKPAHPAGPGGSGHQRQGAETGGRDPGTAG